MSSSCKSNECAVGRLNRQEQSCRFYVGLSTALDKSVKNINKDFIQIKKNNSTLMCNLKPFENMGENFEIKSS